MGPIGHYTILEQIGAGGLGTVYRARDTRLGRTVAVKVFPATMTADPAVRTRLLEDAGKAGALSHPSLVALYERGEDAAGVYLVFEYVAGETLRAVIGDRPLNLRRALDLGLQLADALAEVHRHGLVHAAVRPDAILVTGTGRAKIFDAGLARWTSTGAAWLGPSRRSPSDLAGAASVLAYLSPEQALGETFDHRSDVFTLGAILYEMLTGRSPFFAGNAENTILQVVQAVPLPPSRLNPHVPREVDQIVKRSLMKSLEARTKSADALASELRAVIGSVERREPSPARPVAVPRPSPVAVPRRPVNWLLVVVVLVLLAAAAWAGRAEVLRLLSPN
jgi:serine/threonine protein kinase